MKKKINQVRVLLDALPYIKRYSDEIFVIKYGGSAQITPEFKEKFARDIVLMYLVGIKPVIVHGGVVLSEIWASMSMQILLQGI